MPYFFFLDTRKLSYKAAFNQFLLKHTNMSLFSFVLLLNISVMGVKRG